MPCTTLYWLITNLTHFNEQKKLLLLCLFRKYLTLGMKGFEDLILVVVFNSIKVP